MTEPPINQTLPPQVTPIDGKALMDHPAMAPVPQYPPASTHTPRRELGPALRRHSAGTGAVLSPNPEVPAADTTGAAGIVPIRIGPLLLSRRLPLHIPFMQSLYV